VFLDFSPLLFFEQKYEIVIVAVEVVGTHRYSMFETCYRVYFVVQLIQHNGQLHKTVGELVVKIDTIGEVDESTHLLFVSNLVHSQIVRYFPTQGVYLEGPPEAGH